MIKQFVFLLLACSALLAEAAGAYTPKDYSHLLEMPGFSKELLKMHFTLYQGYVKNANYLLLTLQAMNEKGGNKTYEYGALKRRLGWEFDGMRLHELYFGNLGGNGIPDKKTLLYQTILAQFGNFSKWKEDFIATGSIRGIGWAVLYLDKEQKNLVNAWINEHDVGHLVQGTPLLIMDVFEHAFMPQFGLDKAKYIDVFFNNIDWKIVDARYADALQKN